MKARLAYFAAAAASLAQSRRRFLMLCVRRSDWLEGFKRFNNEYIHSMISSAVFISISVLGTVADIFWRRC
jgi:hypothetical protein